MSAPWPKVLATQTLIIEMYARAMHEGRSADAVVLANGMLGNVVALLAHARAGNETNFNPQKRKAYWQNLPAEERAAIKASHKRNAPTPYRA